MVCEAVSKTISVETLIGGRGECLLFSETVTRPKRKRLQDLFAILFETYAIQPALWYEGIGVAEVKRRVVSRVLADKHGRLI